MSSSNWAILIAIYAAIFIPMMSKRRKRCGNRRGSLLCLVLIVLGTLVVIKVLKSQPHVFVTAGPIVHVQHPTLSPTTTSGAQWIDDWQAFTNSAPPGVRWVRGESTLCGSEDDARHEAAENARNQIVQIIGKSFGRPNVGFTDQPLTDQINQMIQTGQSHVQKTTKPYGDVWQAMVLVDASNPILKANVIDPALSNAQALNEHIKSQVLATGAMLLVVVLLYAFLNMATKGYFVSRLRAAAVMALIVTMLAVLAWI